MDLERELRNTLRRKDPPPGFADRVMARLEPQSIRKGPPRWTPWAVAAALLLSTGGGVVYRQRQEQARGEQAKEQLLLALQVTGAQLDHVRARVRSVSNQEE
jgi:hypothetical protein